MENLKEREQTDFGKPLQIPIYANKLNALFCSFAPIFTK